ALNDSWQEDFSVPACSVSHICAWQNAPQTGERSRRTARTNTEAPLMANNCSGARLMQSGYATWSSASTRAFARAMGTRLEELLTNHGGDGGSPIRVFALYCAFLIPPIAVNQ